MMRGHHHSTEGGISMARYIVIRVESAETAKILLERFTVVPAIRVVGLFASPTSFCEGKCDNEGRSVRSRKWGLRFCPVCKKPKMSIMQQPRNLLQDIDLHPRFADMFLSVWEPFGQVSQEEKYGEDTIARVSAQVQGAVERVSRSKRRKRRKTDG
jgi:hypothetical protein